MNNKNNLNEMLRYYYSIFKKAFDLTIGFFGWNSRSLVAVFSFILGFLFDLYRRGFSPAIDEMLVSFGYGILGTSIFALLLFGINLIRAPFVIQKILLDNYPVSEQPDNTDYPRLELRSGVYFNNPLSPSQSVGVIITNHESSEITECHGDLENFWSILDDKKIPAIMLWGIRGKPAFSRGGRLAWEERELVNQQGTITIDPKGSKLLCLVRPQESYFNLTFHQGDEGGFLPGEYLIRFRVFGKISGKSFAPKIFDVRVTSKDDGTITLVPETIE
jgi:hypothetical protein